MRRFGFISAVAIALFTPAIPGSSSILVIGK